MGRKESKQTNQKRDLYVFRLLVAIFISASPIIWKGEGVL